MLLGFRNGVRRSVKEFVALLQLLRGFSFGVVFDSAFFIVYKALEGAALSGINTQNQNSAVQKTFHNMNSEPRKLYLLACFSV